ncbi:MAG TPA: 6-bladed beta-propeller [Candidatus Angelobacter sp.]
MTNTNLKRGVAWSVPSIALLLGVTLLYRSIGNPVAGPSIYGFAWYKVLDVGQRFPDVTVDRDGTLTNLREVFTEHLNLVLCTPNATDRRLTDYGSVLLDMYRGKGLQIVYIFPGPNAVREADRAIGERSAGMVFVSDRNGQLKKHLGLQDPYTWFFVVDAVNVTRFSIPQPVQPDTLRQLAERFVLHKISYSEPVAPTGYSVHAKLPALTIENLSGSRRVNLGDLQTRGSTILFLRAECTSCSVQNFMRQLGDLWKAGVDFEKERIYPIFSRAFTSLDLKQSQTGTLVADHVYIASSYLPSWENPYLVGSSSHNTPMAISVGDDGTVSSVVAYSDWYTRQMANAHPSPYLSHSVLDPNAGTCPKCAGAASPDPPLQLATGRAPGAGTYHVVPLIPRSQPAEGPDRFQWLSGMQHSPSGGIYALDSLNHRIVLLTTEGTIVQQIGEIGQGPGEFYEPSALAVGPDKRLYVLDLGNSRVQVLEPDGRHVSSFWIDTTSDAIGVNSKGEILLNTPRKGQLMTAYTSEGREIRSFGNLINISHGFPNRSDVVGWSIPLGRANLIVDPKDDSIYVVFQFMPLVQKYSWSGQLLWELRLKGKSVDDLAAAFWKDPGALQAPAVKSMDGVQFVSISTAACLTDRHNLVVVLADRTLYIVTPDGAAIAELHSDSLKGGSFQGVTALDNLLFASSVRAFFRAAKNFEF